MADKKALAMVFGLPKHPDDGPDEDGATDGEGSSYPPEFEQACEEAFDAIKAGDKKAFCESIWAAFHIADSEPHKEGEHEGDEGDY